MNYLETSELLNQGMNILIDNLGVHQTLNFIQQINEPAFDYTEWQRKYFDAIPEEKLRADIKKFFNHERK